MAASSKLQAVRAVAGLSARELAEASHRSVRSVERAESRGDRIRPSTYRLHVDAARRLLRERLDALDRLAGAADQ